MQSVHQRESEHDLKLLPSCNSPPHPVQFNHSPFAGRGLSNSFFNFNFLMLLRDDVIGFWVFVLSGKDLLALICLY